MKLSELASKLKADHSGEASVSGIASVASAKASDLVYAADEKHLAEALKSHAAAVLTSDFARTGVSKKPLIFSKNPKLAFARAAKILRSGEQVPVGIHPSAIVSPDSKLGKDVFI